MKQTQFILLSFCFMFSSTYSQKQYQDYIVNKKNDTIYGVIRNVPFDNRVLLEKNTDATNDKIAFYSHSLSKAKAFRYNDVIYVYEKPIRNDGIYAEKSKTKNDTTLKLFIGKFVNEQPKLPDYVVLLNNDTIFGTIHKPIIGKLYFTNTQKEETKIEAEKIKSYRYKNNLFRYMEKKRVELFDNKNAYLKVLYDGKIKLYEYEYSYEQGDLKGSSLASIRQRNYFYIEKNNKVYLIRDLLHKPSLLDIFADNKILHNKILNEEYSIDNIYLIAKYSSENY